MKRMGTLVLAGVMAVGLGACQKQDSGAVDKKLDEVLARLGKIEEQMQRGGAGAARPAPQRPATPDPATVFSVPIEGSAFEGPEHAKITVVKAFEFACPFCERVNPTLEQLRKDYGDDLKIVYKNFVVHPQVAYTPAYAACAAQKQGKYVEMKKLIWDKGFSAGRNLSQENMEKLAGEAGLDMAKFKADMGGEACKKQVQEEQAEMARVGVRGTPAFYINGRFLSGAQPIQNFKRIIDEELKKANEEIAKGTPVEQYYAKFVVEKGEKSMKE